MKPEKSKRGRKRGSIVYNSPTYHTLKIIAAAAAGGIMLGAFIFAPNAARLAKPILRYLRSFEEDDWQWEQAKLRRAIGKLEKRRLVEIMTKNNEKYLRITQAGKKILKKFDIETLEIKESDEWDKKWRLVLFDIPEKYKLARDALRKKLRSLGFYQLQKSSFIYPYECRDEVDFVTEFFGITRYIQYITCEDLGTNEGIVRSHFDLL